ncbi:MAG TPA: M1 family aminopeptidase [Polyangiaceae bacterium]|nr:M1 family aminopeptidase [Polyangiaceae bacterium]
MSRFERLHERCACSALGPSPFSLAGTERKYERSRPFTVRHTFLDIELDFARRSVSGRAFLEIERMAPDAVNLDLDAIGFEIASVALAEAADQRGLPFEYDGERLRVSGFEGRDRARIEIVYRAVPQRGLYFLGPDAQVKDRPVQVWTQCQDEDARHWFPCHDKPHVKMTSELRVKVPAEFVALSNGDLLSEKRAKNGVGTFHFKLDSPHPSYLVTLVVGRFAIEKDRDAELEDGRRIPVRYYVPVSRAKDAKRSLGETPRMIELFSRLTQVPFPFSRYSQVVVHDFVFGGMENTTATTLYEHVLLDARATLDVTSNDLVAHELAHQWFGDFVTCRDWSHAWLNEGFATYFEHVEREHRLGRDEYDYGVRGDVNSYLSEAGGRYRRPIVCRDYSQPIDLFDRHLYEKGGLVLHMLRRELGDQLFFAGVTSYLREHANGIVETNDLMRAFERVSGRSLEQFFDHWVYRAGHPDLKVKVSYEDGLVSVALKQSQKPQENAIFEFDFEIEILDSAGERTRHKKRCSGAEDSLTVPLPRRPQYVAFDPEYRVIGSIGFEAPSDMLRNQLAHGSSALLKWVAAEALARKPDQTALGALGQCLSTESQPWMVRVEAARALGSTRSPLALEELAKHVKTKHPKVRRAVAGALGQFRNERAFDLLRPLAAKDPSYLVESEAARSLGRTRQKGALKLLTSLLSRDSWADIVRMGALDGMGALRDEAALDLVIEHTRYGHPTRGRRAALSALPDLSESKRVREHLESLLDDPDPHLRSDVASALVALRDARSRPALRRALEHELDGRVVRRLREALRDLSDTSGDRKRLADELETLRNELTELKARLARLESKKPEAETPPKPRRATLPALNKNRKGRRA